MPSTAVAVDTFRFGRGTSNKMLRDTPDRNNVHRCGDATFSKFLLLKLLLLNSTQRKSNKRSPLKRDSFVDECRNIASNLISLQNFAAVSENILKSRFLEFFDSLKNSVI